MAASETTPSAIIFMADYGHDPTETAVPYTTFKNAGFKVDFVTETGKKPECDKLMLTGWTQKLLGATKQNVDRYKELNASPEFQSPLSWEDTAFADKLKTYDLVFLPGGHEKGVRQLYDSAKAKSLVGAYFRSARKPSRKVVAGICHGVLLLAEATIEDDGSPDAGKSVLHDACTTALPGAMEGFIYQLTRCVLGDYYKTYGAGTENVEDSVRKRLDNPEKQWRSNLGSKPFIVEDETYNYVSARFPPDSEALSKRAIELVKQALAA